MDSTWKSGIKKEVYPQLNNDIEVDICIIGAGITGTTLAYLLSESDKSVALIDRHEVGGGESANTTAMITHFFDFFSEEMVSKFDERTAKDLWDCRQLAMDTIQNLVEKEKIDCDYTVCPSYCYANDQKGFEQIKKECEFGRDNGYSIELKKDSALPFKNKGYVKLYNQAKFHPLKYIDQLSKVSAMRGVKIFENTPAHELEFKDGTYTIKSSNGQIRAKKIVIATNFPFTADVLFVGKLTAYNSYVVEVEIGKDLLPQGNFWDTNDTYFYFRVERGENADRLIIGGCDHRTGEITDKNSPYEEIEKYIVEKLKISTFVPKHSWSGQVIKSLDKIPYIGLYKDQQYVATGFWGNGMTFGTFSAMLLRDLLLDQSNPYIHLYDPNRFKGAVEFVKEGMKNAGSFVKEYSSALFNSDIGSLENNSGKVLRVDGQPTAVYKDETGKITKCSAKCPHMGCIVNWNNNDQTWDCPCHGSRYDKKGKIITGPSTRDLKSV